MAIGDFLNAVAGGDALSGGSFNLAPGGDLVSAPGPGAPPPPYVPPTEYPIQDTASFNLNPEGGLEAKGQTTKPSVAAALNQPTVSSTVDPSTLDKGQFNLWYGKNAAAFGLHPDPNHPDMNVNIHDLFARGGQFVATPGNEPDVIRTADGKETKITPQTMPMVQTPEQVAQARQPAAATTLAPLPAPTPAAPSGAPMATPPPITGDLLRSNWNAGGGALPTTGAQLVAGQPTPENPTAVDMITPKIMTAAGLFAAAVDPKRFGQAGEALAGLGQKELVRGRANAAAILAGYPSAEAMEAAKTEMGTRKGLAETAVDYTRVPYIQAEAAKIRAQIPGIPVEQALTQARVNAQNLLNKNYIGTINVPFRDPMNGQVTMIPVPGEHAFTAMNQNVQNLTHFIGTMASAGHAGAQTDVAKQQLVNMSRTVPMLLPNGQTVNYTVEEYIRQQSTKPEWATQNQRQLQLYKSTVEPINKLYENSLGGKVVLPDNLKTSAEVAAQSLINDPDPMWQAQGLTLYALIGRPAPTGVAERIRGGASAAAPAAPGGGPSWLNARPGGR